MPKNPLSKKSKKKRPANWKATYGAKRKRKYKTDPDYRRGRRKAELQKYREEHPESVDKMDSMRKHLLELASNGAALSDLSQSREVGGITQKTFLTKELAEAISIPPLTLYRWQASGRFPKPSVKVGTTSTTVFTLSQAESICVVLAEHFKNKLYLRRGDKETITALFSAV